MHFRRTTNLRRDTLETIKIGWLGSALDGPGGGYDKILLSPGRVGPVDADHDLAAPEAARAHGLGDQTARGDFLVGGDRIFEIEDQRVRGQRLGLRQRLRVGAGHVEDAATRASKHEHLPSLTPSI